MGTVKIWEEERIIPTYDIGEADKNPMFLEGRVYQGSSGKIYPYSTVETISDVKTDKTYRAVWLENEYLKVMVLPGLGGTIQRALDKANGYDSRYETGAKRDGQREEERRIFYEGSLRAH